MTSEDHFVARILNYIKARWQSILVGSIIGLVLGIIYLHSATKYYTATVVVGPTSAVPAEAGLGNLSSLSLSSLGGIGAKISSFVGGNSDSSVAPFDAFQQTLTSNTLALRLLARTDLIHRLYYKSWNEKGRRWQEPSGIMSPVRDVVRSLLGLPAWHPPDADTIELYLNDKLAKTPLPGSSMISLSFEFEDPSVARDFLEAVYGESDKIVRNIDLVRSTKIIDSVNAELNGSTSLSANATESLIQFLDQEHQVKALARANVAYAADTFDALSVSPRPTWPTPGPAIAFGIFFGAIGGIIYATVSHRLRKLPAKDI